MLGQRVSLRTELAAALPPVLGDRIQLQQVVINLVMNGLEAMAPVTDRAARDAYSVAAARSRRGTRGGAGLRHRD